jgi:hypothetical protein
MKDEILKAIPKEDRLLTVQEFNALSSKGVINPYKLRLAQGGIELSFANPKMGKIFDLTQGLAENPKLADELPPVEIGIHEGEVWCFDTRRVVSAQKARQLNKNVVLHYVKLNPEGVAKRIGNFDARMDKGLVVAIRPNGMQSSFGSLIPHVNPAYCTLLTPEDLVTGGKERMMFAKTYGKGDSESKSEMADMLKRSEKMMKQAQEKMLVSVKSNMNKSDDWETD